MQKKLTLSIDRQIIKRAKEYAKRSNRSLSDIIETYLERITDQNADEIDHELSQIVGVIELPADFDEKKEIRNILTEKYK
ncbi:DUF6364 family protein [Portibacter marinus]|uniref:DUF6364 family protein n=1 Tax=Portibacter marinus TaxID=2898660 RepID=UPI001F321532|nr:DUF6364 family protein [Portibacter marinus]